MVKRTIKLLSKARNSNSNSNNNNKKEPTAYNKFRAAHLKKLMENSNSNNNNKVNYAGVEYNVPYFILPNGMIISRHSMFGTIRNNYGRPSKNVNIVQWVKNQQKNNSKKNLIFIVNPLSKKVWTVGNVKIVT